MIIQNVLVELYRSVIGLILHSLDLFHFCLLHNSILFAKAILVKHRLVVKHPVVELDVDNLINYSLEVILAVSVLTTYDSAIVKLIARLACPKID